MDVEEVMEELRRHVHGVAVVSKGGEIIKHGAKDHLASFAIIDGHGPFLAYVLIVGHDDSGEGD